MSNPQGIQSVEETYQERRFAVRWYVHTTHPTCGVIRGRTFYVGRSSLLFISDARYRCGDQVNMDIFIEPTRYLTCKGRITSDKSPYRVELQWPGEEEQKFWNDLLLQMVRTNVRKRNYTLLRN